MKLSCVILTMGDRGEELERAIGSALAQRDADVEVIVVGNGADVVAPDGVTVIGLAENVGVAAGRNAGVITGLGITGAIYTASGSAHADAAASSIFGAAAVICVVVAAIAAVTYRTTPRESEPSRAVEASLEGRAVSGAWAPLAGNQRTGATPDA